MVAALAAAAAAAAVLTVNTSSVSDRAWVRVTYSNLPTPYSDAFFGVFYPADANVTAVGPLPYPAEAPFLATAAFSWISCADMPGCATSGSGFYDFELINSFTTAAIMAFTGGYNAPRFVASTPALVFSDASLPMRGHLARVAAPDEMLVVWHSQFADADASVEWGPTPGGPYPFSALSEPRTYQREDLCGFPTSVATSVGWSDPYFWHTARITGLVPGSRGVVYYRYGSASHGFSGELSFMPPPAVGPHTPVNIIAIADMGMTPSDGTENHWQEPDAGLTTEHMASLAQSGSGFDYSLVLHAGDIVYSTGYALKWNLFNNRLSGLADRVPYLLGQGNHERDWPSSGSYVSNDSGGECGIPTQVRFPSPTQSSGSQDQGWWSIVHGSALIIMINTEMSVAPGSDQYAFLESTLNAANRSETPWIIAAGHRPMYYVDTSANGGARDAMFGVIEPLLMQYKVDLYLVGHVHNFFSSCPMYNSSCVAAPAPGAYDAPVHVCIGNAGQGLSGINAKNPPKWVTFQANEWGLSAIHVYNATTMTLDYYDDDTFSLRHEVVIRRTFPRT